MGAFRLLMVYMKMDLALENKPQIIQNYRDPSIHRGIPTCQKRAIISTTLLALLI